MIRCKFKVEKIVRTEGWNTGPDEVHEVTMKPVISGSKENKEFFAATPGGELVFSTVNANATAGLNPGDEFYLDLVPVE